MRLIAEREEEMNYWKEHAKHHGTNQPGSGSLNEEEKPIKKQKKKKGRVVRISPELVALINKEQLPNEHLVDTLDRLFLDVEGYVLPSDLHKDIKDARGKAIVRALKAKIKKTERPIPVRVAK
jgi:hypothetical protein